MQQDLFSDLPSRLPPGCLYQPDFLSRSDEAELLALIADLPLQEARYKNHSAHRRVVSYGSAYDFDADELRPAGALPSVLEPLRHQVAAWLARDASSFTHALVAEYRPGTPLGWHRDVPDFECIVGVSLAGPGRMRLRPYPPQQTRRTHVIELELPARSVYVLSGEARWGWQHCTAATPTLRYSITFRTPRARDAAIQWATAIVPATLSRPQAWQAPIQYQVSPDPLPETQT